MGVELNKPVRARFIKYSAEGLPQVPEWHEAAGSKVWLFIDEIIIR